MSIKGLNEAQVIASREEHGNNSLTQIMPDPLWKKILQGFKDPMIMILLVALLMPMDSQAISSSRRAIQERPRRESRRRATQKIAKQAISSEIKYRNFAPSSRDR